MYNPPKICFPDIPVPKNTLFGECKLYTTSDFFGAYTWSSAQLSVSASLFVYI